MREDLCIEIDYDAVDSGRSCDNDNMGDVVGPNLTLTTHTLQRACDLMIVKFQTFTLKCKSVCDFESSMNIISKTMINL